jgi:hypothetical protein
VPACPAGPRRCCPRPNWSGSRSPVVRSTGVSIRRRIGRIVAACAQVVLRFCRFSKFSHCMPLRLPLTYAGAGRLCHCAFKHFFCGCQGVWRLDLHALAVHRQHGDSTAMANARRRSTRCRNRRRIQSLSSPDAATTRSPATARSITTSSPVLNAPGTEIEPIARVHMIS